MNQYLKDLGYETDVWLSVLTGGPRDTTVSLRVATAAKAGGIPACILCKILSVLVEWNHCPKTLAGENTSTSASLRAAATFAVVLGGMWAAWKFGGPAALRWLAGVL